MVSSNFQERFNSEKARKNTNENSAFCVSFTDFFTQSSQYQILKASTYSILTNGNPTWTASVSEFSTRISKFYEPSNSERKLYKTRIENWLSIGLELASP